eukprot:1159249-Pelagomonas_calceolata.AAC.4
MPDTHDVNRWRGHRVLGKYRARIRSYIPNHLRPEHFESITRIKNPKGRAQIAAAFLEAFQSGFFTSSTSSRLSKCILQCITLDTKILPYEIALPSLYTTIKGLSGPINVSETPIHFDKMGLHTGILAMRMFTPLPSYKQRYHPAQSARLTKHKARILHLQNDD